MRSVTGPRGRSLGGIASVLSELLSVVEHVAELEALLGVLVVVRRDDGLKNALGLIRFRDLVHPPTQAVICITEGSKDQPYLLGTTRYIIRGVVGVDN